MGVEIRTVSKEKAAHASKAKQSKEFIHHFTLAGRGSTISRKAGLHHM